MDAVSDISLVRSRPRSAAVKRLSRLTLGSHPTCAVATASGLMSAIEDTYCSIHHDCLLQQRREMDERRRLSRG